MPGIGTRNKDTDDFVPGAMPKCSLARLEKTRILVEKRWQNRPGEVVFDGAVGKGGSESLSIALRALPIAGLAVFSLTNAGEKTVPGDLDVVERAASHDLKLLANRKRRDLAGIFQRQEVWQGIEEP